MLDGGNTAWILTSTALVLFMTIPGLSLFYGGLVRGKNVPQRADAMLHHHLPHVDPLDGRRLQPGIRRSGLRRHRRSLEGIHERSD